MKTKKKVARRIAKVDNNSATQYLYKLTPPLHRHVYVVVSAAVVPYSGPETYIFASNSRGKITKWTELEGSFRGGLDHAQALKYAGYEIAK